LGMLCMHRTSKKKFYTRPLLGSLFLAACNLVSAKFIRYLLTILVQTTSKNWAVLIGVSLVAFVY